MMKKSKMIAILIAILMFFSIFAVVSSVSAAATKTIDCGQSMVNEYTDISWNVKQLSTKKVVVSEKRIDSKNLKNTTTTVTIKYYQKNKLKITKSVNTVFGLDKNSIINPNNDKIVKSKLNPKDYYLKVYKVSLLKKIPSKVTFDTLSAPLKNNLKANLKINTVNAKSGTISHYKRYNGVTKNDLKVVIQQNAKNRLKITTTDLKTKKSSFKIVKSTLTPKAYYLKIYKPKFHNEIFLTGEIDNGTKVLDVASSMMWNTVYYNSNKTISVKYDFKYTGFPATGNPTGALIQQISSSKYNITTYIPSIMTGEISSIVTSNLTILSFYFDVFKPKYIL
jgi:hypothetical protein